MTALRTSACIALFAVAVTTGAEETTMTFRLGSPAFDAGASIPARHTCDAQDLSPALEWSDPPPGTGSFALIVDDPDAPVGTWVHWVIYDLPRDARSLAEGVPPEREPGEPPGARQGMNDFRRIGYGGPCPPPGGAHRYFFKLCALDAPLGLAPGATKQQVEHAMEGHVLGRAEVMGTYARGR